MRKPSGVLDLTRVLTAGFPTAVPGVDPPSACLATDYDGPGFRGQRWSLYEHAGTHVDAPVHFIPGQIDVTQIQPADLVGAVQVIDISARARQDPDTLLTEEDVLRHETDHGRIPPGAAVLLRTGWDLKPADRYLGFDGSAYRSPGYSGAAVRWLLEHRDIRCLGIDTASLDAGTTTDNAAHLELLGAGRYGIEGLTNLHRLPPTGATLITAVVPWENGTGGPCRALALI